MNTFILILFLKSGSVGGVTQIPGYHNKQECEIAYLDVQDGMAVTQSTNTLRHICIKAP